MQNPYDLPILRGEDNEYGDYDYLIDELPSNVAKWRLSRYASSCDQCTRYRHLYFESRQFFYTLDGYDSLDYNECWVCSLKSAVRSFLWKAKRNANAFLFALRIAIKAEQGWKIGMFRAAYNIMRGK